MDYALLIFDIDGTLADRDSGDLLPGRREFFLRLAAAYPAASGPQLALASNQGGVGLRYCLKTTPPAWFKAMSEAEQQKRLDTYPSEGRVIARLSEVATTVASLSQQWPATYISFTYQFKNGGWADPPPDAAGDPRWSREWRKPNAGMLRQAMADAGVMAGVTLMVGDREEDRGAAEAAGVNFVWAKDFFEETQ